MYFPSISRIWASNAGKAPKMIKVKGKNIHWKKMVIFFNLLTPLGIGGKSIVESTAETIMPTNEIVMTLLVKIGKLKDSIVTLNLFPPKNIGSQPSAKSNSDAVAQDQYPSIKVYE